MTQLLESTTHSSALLPRTIIIYITTVTHAMPDKHYYIIIMKAFYVFFLQGFPTDSNSPDNSFHAHLLPCTLDGPNWSATVVNHACVKTIILFFVMIILYYIGSLLIGYFDSNE